MIRKSLWIASILLVTTATNAGFGAEPTAVNSRPDKIHVLMLSDINADGISDGVRQNERFISNLFKNQCGKLLSGGEVTRLHNPDDLAGANIRRTIANASVGTNDVLVCYVSEHGGFKGASSDGTPDVNSHFFGSPISMLRTDLWRALKAKNARLTVLISDSCFSSVNLRENRGAAAIAPVLVQKNALYYLLRNYKGDVDINGASPFTFGLYSPNGGIFSTAFWTTSLYTANPNGTWTDFFNTLKHDTQKLFQSDYPDGVDVDVENINFHITLQTPYEFSR
jgi:hypothetical protein